MINDRTAEIYESVYELIYEFNLTKIEGVPFEPMYSCDPWA